MGVEQLIHFLFVPTFIVPHLVSLLNGLISKILCDQALDLPHVFVGHFTREKLEELKLEIR